MIKLSVIIPVYNEKTRFQNGFDHYFSYLKKQKYPWELILVNDGSTDNTLKLISDVKKGKPNINVVTYSINRGKGYAIAQGVKSASGEYILFADLDHSVPIDTIESFFKFFEKNYQVVIGSRRVKGSQILVHQKPLREFLGKGFTAIVNFLIYPQIADATCGFKAFKKNVAQNIFNKITVYDWAFDAEILYICKKSKIKIAQAPVTWTDVRGSKVSLVKDVANSLKGIFQIRFNDLMGKYS